MIAGRYNRSTSLATIKAYLFFSLLLYKQRSTNLRVKTWWMHIVKDDSMCQLIGVEDVIGHTSAIDLKLFSIHSFVQHCPTTKADSSSTVVISRYGCNLNCCLTQ